jgi:CDP-glucose 4,6-dehydratase
LESLELTPSFWRDKSVFLTGHTGFKGGWLALWLASMGARVHGFSLLPPTSPDFFTASRVKDVLASHTIGDIRDLTQLSRAMRDAEPEIVLHLAAQPLVRASYREPVETYAINVMGTVHLLESVRQCPTVRAVVNVTTDKCYENKEWHWAYRESEPMGGHDPYSNSKACSELVTAAYRSSFLAGAGVAVASARAGNVIGGGDWATDRLIPDFFRAAQAGKALEIRHPDATRPWQHVLEPLSGYLLLAEHLVDQGQGFAEAWNFGPDDEGAKPVRWLLSRLTEMMPGTSWHQPPAEHVHEAGLLKLDSSKARSRLGWAPRWGLRDALRKTVDWQLACQEQRDMLAFSLAQIAEHQAPMQAPHA